jgi:hypothetical protein
MECACVSVGGLCAWVCGEGAGVVEGYMLVISREEASEAAWPRHKSLSSR